MNLGLTTFLDKPMGLFYGQKTIYMKIIDIVISMMYNELIKLSKN